MNRPDPAYVSIDRVLTGPLAAALARGSRIGAVGFDVPPDLLAAVAGGGFFLPWRTGRPTPFADAWLENSFPGVARSILEDWAAGAFDALDAVMFSRGDDATQRLFYYVRELQRRGKLRGPAPLVFDVARIPRDSSRRHTEGSLRLLAARLGVGDAALAAGIRATDHLREGLAAMTAEGGLDGVARHRLARGSLFSDIAPAISLAALPGGPGAAPEAAPARPRIVLAGSAPPDERLHEAVAAAGGDVVAELHAYSFARLGAPVRAEHGDPFVALAAQVHASGSGPRGFGAPARRLLATCTAARADAVVLWLTREDEALAWHLPEQQQALRDASIPHLALPARRWDAADDAIASIDEFTRKLPR
jgi:hypothetical protein